MDRNESSYREPKREETSETDYEAVTASLPQPWPHCEWTPQQKRFLKWKRVFDVIFSCLVLLGLSWLYLLVAVAIKLSSPNEPVLFKQYRVGKDYRSFKIYKFRTMVSKAPKNVASGELENARQYITPLGAFLRKSSIDELPQFWNILKGDMSLIGPRPLVYTEREIRYLRKYYEVYRVRPGITGIAQINGRDRVTLLEKIRMDREYIRYVSFRLDWEIFWQTVVSVLRRRGVFEGCLPAENAENIP